LSQKKIAQQIVPYIKLIIAPHPIVAPGNVVGFHVAFTLVPAVFTQEVLEVSVIAAEHSLLPGWANELIERVNPNNTMMTGGKRILETFHFF
jgi:hypothetical protein